MRLIRLALAAVMALSGAAAHALSTNVPLLRFGVVADVQYANKPTILTRNYRDALAKLNACVEDLNRQPLDFVVNLGDVIDGNGPDTEKELAEVARAFRKLRAPVYHVVGNHCLAAGRAAYTRYFKIREPYYSFTHRNWRFVVLDGMDISIEGPSSPAAEQLARKLMARDPELLYFNGAVGDRQMRWLREELEEAARQKLPVMVLCHFPTLAAASHPAHLLWNYQEVGNVVAGGETVRAFLAGHYHAGTWVQQGRVHHVTFPALLDSPEGSNCYSVVEVYPGRFIIRGTGTAPNRDLAWPPP